MSPAYPSKKLTRPLLTKDGRRVLELLVGSARQGCTEAFLLAHGFTVDLLADMVRAGFATAQIERVRAGGQPIEVTRVSKSAFGTKRTWPSFRSMSAFGGKADIASRTGDVRRDPKRKCAAEDTPMAGDCACPRARSHSLS